MFCIAEALIVNYLALAQKANGILNIGVIAKTQDVVVGGACFLLGRQILVQIGDWVALDGKIRRRKGCARCRLGIYSRCVINKVGVKACLFDFIGGEVAGQLINDRAYHL